MDSQDTVVFSHSAHVQIQGDAVLRIKGAELNRATYELVGFEHYPVLIEDTRQIGLDALNDYFTNKRAQEFAPKFNHPAHVEIISEPPTKLTIRLSETENKNPDFMLWIAIGIEESLPDYSFVILEDTPYRFKSKAILSLYRRPAALETNQFSTASDLLFDIPMVQNSNCVDPVR